MAQTFYLGSTASDLTGGADWNRYLEQTTETAGTVNAPVAAGATEVQYGFTRAGVPSGGIVPGDFTVELENTQASTARHASIQLHRVDSSGVVQASSSISAEQTLSPTGVKTFSFTGVDLGTWSSGDRLRVDYRFRNSGGLASTFIIRTGTTDTEVVTPDGGIALAVGRATETDAARPVTWSPKHRLIGQPSETDTARTIEPRRSRIVALAQVVEADTARAVEPHRLVYMPLGRAAETDLALAIRSPNTQATAPHVRRIIVPALEPVLLEDATQRLRTIEQPQEVIF